MSNTIPTGAKSWIAGYVLVAVVAIIHSLMNAEGVMKDVLCILGFAGFAMVLIGMPGIYEWRRQLRNSGNG